MRKGQNFFPLPVTCRRGTKAEGGQPGVGKAVKSRAGGLDRPVDRPSAGRPPSLVSYCLNRRPLFSLWVTTESGRLGGDDPVILFRAYRAELPEEALTQVDNWFRDLSGHLRPFVSSTLAAQAQVLGLQHPDLRPPAVRRRPPGGGEIGRA